MKARDKARKPQTVSGLQRRLRETERALYNAETSKRAMRDMLKEAERNVTLAEAAVLAATESVEPLKRDIQELKQMVEWLQSVQSTEFHKVLTEFMGRKHPRIRVLETALQDLLSASRKTVEEYGDGCQCDFEYNFRAWHAAVKTADKVLGNA